MGARFDEVSTALVVVLLLLTPLLDPPASAALAATLLVVLLVGRRPRPEVHEPPQTPSRRDRGWAAVHAVWDRGRR